MFLGEKNLHRSFASDSPVIVALGFALIIVTGSFAAESHDPSTVVKRQAATTQFARAEEQRDELNSKPSEKRTLSDYKQVISNYRRVALITPRAPEVPDSLLAAAEVYAEMGDRFGRSYYQSAVDSYQFLVHEYPKSKYCQDAILRIAKLQRDRLGDTALAKKTYEDFLKRYPHSTRKREAQESLAELALLENSEASSSALTAVANSASSEPIERDARAGAPVHSGGKSTGRPDSRQIPRVRRIRAAANGEATRIVIDLEDSVQYASGRIANPDRIFFDLHAAKLTPEVARESIHVEGSLLTAVRVAQNHQGVVRVVLDVDGLKDYTASLMNNPSRLVIDLYGASRAGAGTLRAATSTSQKTSSTDDEHTGTIAPNSRPASSQPPHNKISSVESASAPKSSRAKSAKAASAKPDLVTPVSAPQPTHDGQSTLTRALGLKIGRIVIDAVTPDYFAKYPKACMGGWGKRSLNVTPSGRVLPCHAAETIPELEFWNVRDHPLSEIWESSPAFMAFRGTSWMKEPCVSCAYRERDFGGCRCQAFALLGDARAADPVCHLSPHHHIVAELAAVGGDPQFLYRGR
jgi:radical SAM protein with 4Fe4S-binding SPASM domain